MSIWLVRHGETPKNHQRIVQPFDEPLSERGIAQAEALADALKTETFAGVLCSDQPRAMQTAQILNQHHNHEIVYTPLLRERNFGDLRGQSYDDIGFDFFAPDYEPVNGESWNIFNSRIDDAWQEVVKQAQSVEGKLLVVSHGLVCHRIIAACCSNEEELDIPQKFANTSLSKIAKTSPWQLEEVDNSQHLSQVDTSGGAV